MKTLVAALGAAVLLLTPSRPSCAEIFSNFGPGLTFDQDPSHGWGINGYLGPNVGQQAISQQFTPSGGVYVFTDAQVAVGSLSTAGGVVVYLQEDAGGLPGPILEEYVVPVVTGGAPVVSVNSLVHPMLRGGRPYWLSVVAGASRFEGGWFWSLGDVCNGRDAASTQGGSPSGPWDLMFNGEPRGAFAVSGARIVQSPGPPTISPPLIDRVVLWPPDGRMVEVRVDYSFDGGQDPPRAALWSRATSARGPGRFSMSTAYACARSGMGAAPGGRTRSASCAWARGGVQTSAT
ncbi:MAG TPA: hypothetical protein VF960_12635 [Chloroflexota bacterium]